MINDVFKEQHAGFYIDVANQQPCFLLVLAKVLQVLACSDFR